MGPAFPPPGVRGIFRFQSHHFDQLGGIALTAEGEPIDFRWEGRFGRWVRHLVGWVSRRLDRTESDEAIRV